MSSPMSILLTLALLCLALPTALSSVPYTVIRCQPATYTDPYPAVLPEVVTSATSHFYAVTSAALNTLTIHTATPATYNSTTTTTYTSIPAPCFSATVSGTPLTFSPDYGRAVDMQSDVLAIAAPSRSVGVDGSFIDIVSLSLDATTGDITTSTETIYSTDATLGLTLSLSTDATHLAAYYSADQLVVYSPVVGRAESMYNTALDADVLVTYPTAFYVDSIQLSLPYLLVSGVVAGSGAVIQPTLLVYNGTGWPNAITAWTLWSTLTLSATASVPLGYPARSLPLDATVLPDLTAMVAVSCPSQQTVYTTHTSSSAAVGALMNDPTASKLTSFGSAVAVSEDGETVFVLATEGMLVFSSAEMLHSTATEATNAVEMAESILPNRQQHAEVTYKSYSSLSVSNNVTLVLPATSATPLLVPFISASLTFDSTLDTFVACPAGSYRPHSTLASLSPCLFCPVGTYSDTLGSTHCTNCTDEQYCPAGSTYPYTTDEINETPESTIPEFETESFEESFEDLLINGIFSPKTIPMMIAFVVAGVTFIAVLCYVVWRGSRKYVLKVLKLYRFALMPDEEEEREKELEVKSLLDELLDEREKHMPRCPHAVVVVAATPPSMHNRHPSAPGGAPSLPADHHTHSEQQAHVRAGSVDNRRASVRTAAEQLAIARRHEEQRVIEDTKMQEQIVGTHHTADTQQIAQRTGKMKGFFNLLLLLFGISCVVFSWTYLNNYKPDEVGTDEHNNRYRTETLFSVTITDPIQLQGLDAINSVNATIYTHLIGFSGMECVKTEIQGIHLDGCIIQQTNGLCNQSTFWDVYENDDIHNTCTIEFRLVQGTLLSLMSVLHLYLPASLQVQALRYVFQQDAQESAPENHITTGVTTFWDTATHPTDSESGEFLPNALSNYVQRDWVFGILTQTQQIDENNPPTFAYEWYNTVTSLNTGWLPTAPLSDYTHTQSPYTELVLTMQTESFFRSQKTQKLIQMKAAFLTILLGLIAIFHIIEFAKQLFEVFLLVLKKVKKNQALAKVGQVTTARLNQVVDAGMGVVHLAGSSPLSFKRGGGGSGASRSGARVEEREEKQPLSGRSSPQMMHSSRYIETPPPPINPHYGTHADVDARIASNPPSAYPAISYDASAQLSYPPPASSYPTADYGNRLPPLPASQLPYPVTSVSGSSGGVNGGGRFEI